LHEIRPFPTFDDRRAEQEEARYQAFAIGKVDRPNNSVRLHRTGPVAAVTMPSTHHCSENMAMCLIEYCKMKGGL